MRFAKLPDQLEDPGLDGDVECARRLVEDEHPRLHGERASDGDPLALAARQLMRVAAVVFTVEPHLRQQVRHASGHVGSLDDAMGAKGLADRPPHPDPRVERRVGILEHDLHGAPVAFQPLTAQPRDVVAVQADLAALDRNQPQHRPSERGLPGAALADQPETERARRHGQRDAIDGADRAEPHEQVANLEQRRLRRPGHGAGWARPTLGTAATSAFV